MADADIPQNGDSTNTFMFPSDVRLHGHFIMFTAFEYQRGSRGDTSAKKGTPSGRVVLPMPDTLTTNYNAQYDSNFELGFIGNKIAAPVTEKIMQMFQEAKQREQSGGAANPDQSWSQVLEHLNKDLLPKAKGAAGYILLDAFENTQVGGGFQVASGLARNPHLANLFRGVGFRSHSFSYDFIPKTPEETEELFSIIRFFKTWMLPTYDQAFDNNLFNYPHEFQIEFSHPEFLFTIGESVLTSFTPEYHANGKPTYFRLPDGTAAPVNIRLNFSFTETSIVTRKDILEKGR